MSMIKSTNPVMNKKLFKQSKTGFSEDLMTVQGAVNKTFIFLSVLITFAVLGWDLALKDIVTYPLIMVGLFVALGLALFSYFKPQYSMYSGIAYCVVKGVVVGAFSAFYEFAFPGIVIQALLLTSGTLAMMLFLYKAKIIKVTSKLAMGIMMATGGIAIFYLVAILLSFFGVQIPLIHSNGPLGIGFSIVVTVLAALNLLLDFDFIEKGAKKGAAKHMEWFGAFGLIVTLIWLYLEILRLLSKLRR